MSQEHPVFFGQLMLFDACRDARENQALLARAALFLADCEVDGPIDLKLLVSELNWVEYQSLLTVLALRANVAIRWRANELALLRGWALSGSGTG